MSIFVTRGMRVSIPAGGLQIAFSQNNSEAAPVKYQVGIALFPLWLEIALCHLQESVAANSRLIALMENNERKGLGDALEREFSHGMQSITASATAIESFYGSMRPFDKRTKEEVAAMRRNRKRRSRPTQIKESFRRTFRLKPDSAKRLGEVLTEIYRFRDLAVHPPAGQEDPVFHPTLQTGVEWRFVVFSHSNALKILRTALSIMSQLMKRTDQMDSAARKECEESLPLMQPVLAAWEKEFGSLNPPDAE